MNNSTVQNNKEPKQYFVKDKMTGQFVCLKHGIQGKFATTVDTKEHADLLNERSGLVKADLIAAEVCAMTGNWDKFDEIKKDVWSRVK